MGQQTECELKQNISTHFAREDLLQQIYCLCSCAGSQSNAEVTVCFFKNCCYEILQYSDTRKLLQLSACLVSWTISRNAPSVSSHLYRTFWQGNKPKLLSSSPPSPLGPYPSSPSSSPFFSERPGRKQCPIQGCCFCLLFYFWLPWSLRINLIIFPLCPVRTTWVTKLKGSGSG